MSNLDRRGNDIARNLKAKLNPAAPSYFFLNREEISTFFLFKESKRNFFLKMSVVEM